MVVPSFTVIVPILLLQSLVCAKPVHFGSIVGPPAHSAPNSVSPVECSRFCSALIFRTESRAVVSDHTRELGLQLFFQRRALISWCLECAHQLGGGGT